MSTPADLVAKLQSAFPGADVEVRDLTGTGDHFEAKVVSAVFAGKSLSEQHQLVYRELEAWAAEAHLYALALVTQAPASAPAPSKSA